MTDDRRYQIRRTSRFRYAAYYGREYPYCSVVAVCFTEKGAHRAIERDKKKRAKPLPPPPDLVWQEPRQ